MTYIGICTRERPKMLAALLESIAVSAEHAKAQVTVFLVENGPAAGAEAMVEQFADHLNIVYKNEPRLGLVHARNAVIDAFLETEGDAIILLDDDNIVPPKWLGIMQASRQAYPEADAVFGPTVYTYDADAPKIIQKPAPRKHSDGRIKRINATNNCALTRGVFKNGETRHRFDLAYNLSGGEDFDFFARFADRKLTARYFSEAAVYEHVPPSRHAVRFQFSKWQHQGHCRSAVLINRYGTILGGVRIFGLTIIDSARALTFGAIGSFVLVLSEPKGISWFRRALYYAAQATGRPRGLFQNLSDFYEKVDGE